MPRRQPQFVGGCRSGACGQMQPRFSGGCQSGGCGAIQPRFAGGCGNGQCGQAQPRFEPQFQNPEPNASVAQSPLSTPFDPSVAVPAPPNASFADPNPAGAVAQNFAPTGQTQSPVYGPADGLSTTQGIRDPNEANHSAGNSIAQSQEPRSPGGRALASTPPTTGAQPVAVDLDFNFGGKANVCVGVLVGKGPMEDPQMCAVAFLTAGHCVKNGTTEFSTMTVGMKASGLGEDFAIKNAPGRLAYRMYDLPNSVANKSEPAYDSALVRGTVPCRLVTNLPVAELAVGEKPRIGDALTILRRHSSVADPKEGIVNPGGGNAVAGTLNPSPGHNLWKIDGLTNVSRRPAEDGVYVGDSGGPVVDAHGHIFSILSRGPATDNAARYGLVDSEVPTWADATLKNWGFISKDPIAGHSAAGQLSSGGARTQGVRAPASTASAKVAPANGAAQLLSDSQRRAIDQYENGMHYITGNARYRFPEGFTDVPKGGTGKIVIAYFGRGPRADLEALEKQNPLVDFRFYPNGSPEHQQAAIFNVGALGIDGLGRKLSRYDDPIQALRSVNSSGEVALLKNYLSAKQAQTGHIAAQQTPVSAPVATDTPAQLAQTPVRAPSAVSLASAGSITQGVPVQNAVYTPNRNREPLSTNFSPHELGGFVQTNCASCHGPGKSAPPFPSFVSNWEEWKGLLDQGDSRAQIWLAQFNAKVVHGEMLNQAGLSKRSGPGKDFHDFIAAASDRYPGRRTTQLLSVSTGTIGSPGATAMTDPNKLNEYLEVLSNANIADPELKKQILEFDSIWDSTGNPTWSWAPHGGDSGRKGARPVGTTTPAGPVAPELFEYANGQYKWKEPFADGFAADSNTRGLKRFSMVRFPRDASGNIIPGVAGYETVTHYLGSGGNLQKGGFENGDVQTPWASFPPGTRVYEVMYAVVNGKPVAVDIVSREKRTDGKTAAWVPDALRADSSPEKIRAWVAAQSDSGNPDYAKILAAVNNPTLDAIQSQLGRGNGGYPFVVDGRRTNQIAGSKSVVRGVSQATLERMYRELPMESASGKKGWALEPADVFSGSHRGIAVNTQNCRNCHSNAGGSFKTVFGEAGLSDTNVFAYGNVGGYDQILGAPWFSPQDMQRYGRGQAPAYQMRPEWAKFFRAYDPSQHSPEQYRRSDPYAVSNNPLFAR